MLTIILVESALETLPIELTKYESVKKLAKKRKKKPKKLLLDTSLHHNIMKDLTERKKRGRPDIVHFSLLVAINSPLFKSGFLNIYIHTRQNKVIKLNRSIRVPKNYNRFVGLIEQLFEKQKVPPGKEPLLILEDWTLRDFINELNPNEVILFHETGKFIDLSKYFKNKVDYHIISLIGGFPHGSFTKETEACSNLQIAIDPEPLETVSVLGEIIYSYEQAINLQQYRFKKFGIDLQ